MEFRIHAGNGVVVGVGEFFIAAVGRSEVGGAVAAADAIATLCFIALSDG